MLVDTKKPESLFGVHNSLCQSLVAGSEGVQSDTPLKCLVSVSKKIKRAILLPCPLSVSKEVHWDNHSPHCLKCLKGSGWTHVYQHFNLCKVFNKVVTGCHVSTSEMVIVLAFFHPWFYLVLSYWPTLFEQGSSHGLLVLAEYLFKVCFCVLRMLLPGLLWIKNCTFLLIWFSPW